MSIATKQEFLDRLKASIGALPAQDQADILNDYEEHFRIGMENGKTEAEIADSLGSPEELGASFTEESAQPGTAPEEIYSYSEPAQEPVQEPVWGFQPEAQAPPDFSQQSAPPPQPPYPPNARAYAAPPYEPAGAPAGDTSINAGPLIAMILLTVFIMFPLFLGLIIGISVALVCLCFALGLVSVVLFSFTPIHFGFAFWGLAFIFLALLSLCGLIGFLYGMVKAIAAYCRSFARVVRGKGAQA